MANFKKTNFKKSVVVNTENNKRKASNYGYLQLPKGLKVFKEKEGSMLFDIIPYVVTMKNHPDYNEKLGIAAPGTLWYKLPFKIHRNVGVENDTVVCPTSFGLPCPICEYRAERAKAGAEQDEIKELYPKRRNLYTVIPINDSQPEVPHIYDASDFLFQSLLDVEIEEDEDKAVFPDLEDGMTLKVRYEEKKFKNKFYAAQRIDFKERSEVYDESIIDKIPKMDAMLVIHTYNELKALWFHEELDTEASEVKEEVEETVPDTPVRRKKTTTKPIDDKPEEFDNAIESDPCIACEGTGKTSKGNPCPICGGTGINPESKAKVVVKESKAKSAPVTTRRKTTPKKEEVESGGCPHGHKFGIDIDETDDCGECKNWDACYDESKK